MSLRCAGQTLISSGSRLVRPTDRCRLPPRPTPIPERVAVGVPDSDGCGEECVTCGDMWQSARSVVSAQVAVICDTRVGDPTAFLVGAATLSLSRLGQPGRLLDFDSS